MRRHHAASRLLLLSAAALAVALTASPSGVSVAHACSPAPKCDGSGWKSITLVKPTAPTPLEGVLVAATSSPLGCPKTPLPASLKAEAKKVDGTTVVGVLSKLAASPSSVDDASYVLLWKPVAPLEPSTVYTLVVSGSQTGGGLGGGGLGGGGGSAGGGAEPLASLSFTTAAATGSLVPASLTATLSPDDDAVDSCCHSTDSVLCVPPKATCVAALTTKFRRLEATFSAIPAPLGAYVRYALVDTNTQQTLFTFDGWSVAATVGWATLLKDANEHCVRVESTDLLSGNKVASDTVCPTPIVVKSEPVPHCADLAQLIASCIAPGKLDANATTLFKQHCEGAAGMGGAAGSGTAGSAAGSGAAGSGAAGSGTAGSGTAGSAAAGSAGANAGASGGPSTAGSGGAPTGAGGADASSDLDPNANDTGADEHGGCAFTTRPGRPRIAAGLLAGVGLLAFRRRRACRRG